MDFSDGNSLQGPTLTNFNKGLRQNTNVQDYIFRFRNLLEQISDMAEMDKVHYFIHGLKLRTRMEVNYRIINNLEEAIHPSALHSLMILPNLELKDQTASYQHQSMKI